MTQSNDKDNRFVIEKGFTRVPHALLKLLYSGKLAPAEIRIMLVIIRLTLGFNQTKNEISAGRIARLTGLNRRNIFRALNSLEDDKIIIRSQRAYHADSKAYGVNSYRIADEYLSGGSNDI